MSTRHDFLSIGGVYDGTLAHYYYGQIPREFYDVIIYFDKTMNSQPL